MNVVISDSTVIDSMYEIANEFMDKVLDLDLSESIISDDTHLSDFFGCGDDFKVVEDETYEQLLDRWDSWVCERIYSTYQIKIDKTNITLLSILVLIENQKNILIH